MDVRTTVVRLLKTHSLGMINIQTRVDPKSQTTITTLKFRRKDADHDPKGFFNDLGKANLQYKKIGKDPTAIEQVCEIYIKGTKSRVVRDRSNDSNSPSDGEGGSCGNSNGNLHYIGIPKAKGSEVIQANKIHEAGEQNWPEFFRVITRELTKSNLHSRPEIRQLREHLSNIIVKSLDNESGLYSNMRTSDLESKLKDVLWQNIDLILGTRELANSVMRRSASVTVSQTASLLKLRRACAGLVTLASASGEKKAKDRAVDILLSVTAEIEDDTVERKMLQHPVSILLLAGRTEDAFFEILS